MQDFRKLIVWRKAHELTLAVYANTASFPREEVYALTSQLRRSVSSIPSNIAEGCGRATSADLGRFLNIALGSATEVDYQLQLAHELGYLTERAHNDLKADADDVRKMLISLILRVRSGADSELKTQDSEL